MTDTARQLADDSYSPMAVKCLAVQQLCSKLRDVLQPPTSRGQRLQLLFLEQEKNLYRRSLTKRDLQKLLFLYLKDFDRSDYSFVPFKYGCYSFVGDKDLNVLESRGWVRLDREKVHLLEELNFTRADLAQERYRVKKWLKDNRLRGRELVAASYRSVPYYAINSMMLDDLLESGLLESEDIREIDKEKIQNNESIVFTLGYEGLSIEDYVNKLIQNDVKLVCDIRRNPISRKFGFSKKRFSEILAKLSIEYRHFPDLGIDSKDRKSLVSESDYQKLFETYRKNLPKQEQSIQAIEELLISQKRIALICFEAQHTFCHRHSLCELLEERIESTCNYRIEHL